MATDRVQLCIERYWGVVGGLLTGATPDLLTFLLRKQSNGGRWSNTFELTGVVKSRVLTRYHEENPENN